MAFVKLFFLWGGGDLILLELWVRHFDEFPDSLIEFYRKLHFFFLKIRVLDKPEATHGSFDLYAVYSSHLDRK